MKRWLLRFFNLFPFFDKSEYERQVQAEHAAERSANSISQRNFMEQELMERREPRWKNERS